MTKFFDKFENPHGNKCNCDLCQRHNMLLLRLNGVSEKDKDWFVDLYVDLIVAEATIEHVKHQNDILNEIVELYKQKLGY